MTPSIILPRCLPGFGQFSRLEKFAAGPGGPDKELQSVLYWCLYIEKGDINKHLNGWKVDWISLETKSKPNDSNDRIV